MTDLPGQAIHDFYFKTSKTKLFVHDKFGPKVEMPVGYYFRNLDAMPQIEQKALDLCIGNTLDIGAAAGSHALELQKRGREVTALEVSPAACDVMKDRSVNNVRCQDFFNFEGEKFDTLLLLMNGIGLCGNLDGFAKFLLKTEKLLRPGGQIIFDSCNISYMYEGIQLPEHYFGEVKCRYEYGSALTNWFSWLYLDAETMQNTAIKLGWQPEIALEDENDQYLAVLRKI